LHPGEHTAEAALTASDLELTVDGRLLRFPAVRLRDNCLCPDCVAPGTTQKIKDITDMPNGVAITRTGHADGTMTVTFAPDLDPATGRFPVANWPRYLDEPAERIRALEAVLRLGFVLLRGVPAEPGLVLEVADSFGFVRETNYGHLFDVRVDPVEPAPGNLAYTSRAIRPHTDNPYRDPVPTVQLLHCLRAAGQGGETGLVDGFAAAAALRAADPASFGTLTGTAAPFGYVDNETELRACQPLIELSPRGRVRGVRFNNRSRLPGRGGNHRRAHAPGRRAGRGRRGCRPPGRRRPPARRGAPAE
jgi:gamma-butyrobetaine dioxygenase